MTKKILAAIFIIKIVSKEKRVKQWINFVTMGKDKRDKRGRKNWVKREGNGVNNKRWWKERMKKKDRWNVECVSMKRENEEK